jgi:hypothetical protein
LNAPREPPPVVPVPASEFGALRGRRVIIGLPGTGFRNDLRADNPIVHGSRTHVPVLTEQDYYRAEMDRIEAFALLVPIERVWVEWAGDHPQSTAPQSGLLDRPPTAKPTPVLDTNSPIGRRVVQEVPDGFIRDIRAVTPVYVNADGLPSVQICGEAEWYRWAAAGSVPGITRVDASHLWIE